MFRGYCSGRGGRGDDGHRLRCGGDDGLLDVGREVIRI